MAEKKAPAPRRGGMSVDPKLVRELADMLGETGLTEIEVEEGDRRIRVSRAALAATPAQAMAAPAAAPVAPAPDMSPPNANDAPGNSVQSADTAGAIKSPMVGTAFLAPEPDSADFVSAGDAVKKGDTLLIVEAMKVMNPITAPADGTVQKILVGNGEPVEFDQPLIVIA